MSWEASLRSHDRSGEDDALDIADALAGLPILIEATPLKGHEQ